MRLKSRLVTLLKLSGPVVMAAAALALAPGSAGDDAAAQDNEVLLGPMYGKTFEMVAEAPERACQQLSGPLPQMEWSDRGATDQGLLSLGLVAKTGAVPFTVSGVGDCTWVAVGSDFEAPASDSYDVKFVMDVSGAIVLNGLTSVGCDAERAGAQLFAFLWDQETGKVVASRPVLLPEVEKPTLDHDGCSAQPPVTGLFTVLTGAVDGVVKSLKLGAHTVPLKDLGHDSDIVGAEDMLGRLSSWPAVQRISKEGYEFSLEEPVRLEGGKNYGVGVGLFGFALSLASAATGAGYATVLFEAGSYELYDWPSNFKVEIGPTRLTGIRILPAGAEEGTATPSPTGTLVPRSPTPSATLVSGADVFVTKLDSPDPVVSGEEIIYTLLVANSGSVAATDVRVDDRLPEGVTLVSASPGCSEGAEVSCDIGTLAPGDTATFTIRVTAPSVTSKTSIKNCAVAHADNDQNTNNNDHCQWTSVNPAGTPEPLTPGPTPGSPTPESPTPESPTPELPTPTPTPAPTPACLDAPSSLAANMHWSGGAAWVDLYWTDRSSDEDGFKVERATSAAGPYSVIIALGPDATAWTDYTLAFGPDSYYYRVKAYGLECDSDPSNVTTVPGRWPTPTAAPVCPDVASPTALTVARQYSSDGHFLTELQWQDNAFNETGFAVQRAAALEGPWGHVVDLGPDSTQFTDEPPAGPSFWYYRVLAVGSGPCYSGPSNVAIAPGP
jgi:uncharacterized repeat protein (TIGR01451 family)